jgi:hypothetical protein
MDDYERQVLSEAVNNRIRAVRSWIPQAVQEAGPLVREGPVQVRDGYSAVRYVNKVLWRSFDPDYVNTVDDLTLYYLFLEGVAGAARYRIRLERGHHDEGKTKKARK